MKSYFNKLHLLHEALSYVRQYPNFTIPHFEKLINLVPTLVVWGSQSSGKSSFINKIFDSKNRTKAGIGTCCPVEIYTKKKISQNQVNTYQYFSPDESKILNFQTMEEAENFVSQKNILVEGILRYTLYDEDFPNFCVIDLPGINRHIGSEYFEALKQKYLTPPQTIILHVQNGSTDPNNDFSLNYLSDIDSKKIVSILTHVDHWLTDSNSFHYYNPNAKILFSNQENEESVFQTFSTINPETLHGREKIFEFLFSTLKQKFDFLSNDISTCIREILNEIENIFRSLGRQAPNMQDFCFVFREEMDRRISIYFSEKIPYECSKKFNSLKNFLNSQNLIQKFSLYPTNEEVQQKLSNPSPWIIRGLQSNDEPMKFFIGRMFDNFWIQVKQKLLSNIPSIYREIQMEFKKDFREYSKEKQEKLFLWSGEIFQREFEIFMSKAENEILRMKSQPYVEKNFQTYNYIKHIFMKDAIEFLKQNPFLIQQKTEIILENLKKNPKSIRNEDIEADVFQRQMRSLWEKIIQQFAPNLVQKIQNFLFNFYSLFREEIQKSRPDEFSENNEIILKRNFFLSAEEKFKNLQ